MTSPEKFDSNKAAGQEGSVENPIVPVGKTFSKEELFKYLSDVLKRPITTLRDLVNPEIRDDLQQAFARFAAENNRVDESVWEEMAREGLVGEHPGYKVRVQKINIHSLHEGDVVAIQVGQHEPDNPDYYIFSGGRLLYEGKQGIYLSDLISLEVDGSFIYTTSHLGQREEKHTPTHIYGLMVYPSSENPMNQPPLIVRLYSQGRDAFLGLFSKIQRNH